jgi:hypothetical protein
VRTGGAGASVPPGVSDSSGFTRAAERRCSAAASLALVARSGATSRGNASMTGPGDDLPRLLTADEAAELPRRSQCARRPRPGPPVSMVPQRLGGIGRGEARDHWISPPARASMSSAAPRGSRDLTIAECRRILGPECTDSDDEVRENRDRLMAIAHALLETRTK